MVSKGWDVPLASPGVPAAGMLSVSWEGRGIQLTVFCLLDQTFWKETQVTGRSQLG